VTKAIQVFRDVAADEAGGAGECNFHVVSVLCRQRQHWHYFNFFQTNEESNIMSQSD
jgi:hypothetical protein